MMFGLAPTWMKGGTEVEVDGHAGNGSNMTRARKNEKTKVSISTLQWAVYLM